MITEQIKSWIFLSIAIGSQKYSVNISQIIEIADGINKVIPTKDELYESIFWLKQEKLITEVDNKFSLSEFGKDLFEKARKQKDIFNTWKEIETEFIDK